MSKTENRPIIAGITFGDYNGVGPEIIIRTFLDNRLIQLCTPVVYGSARVASYHRKVMEVSDFSFNIIREPRDANPRRANLINCWEEEAKIDIGQATETAGKFALISLDRAAQDLKDGKIDVLVTAPLNKHTIRPEGQGPVFTGHTGYLAGRFDVKNYLMLMVGERCRIGLVTAHVPLSQVAGLLTADLVYEKIRLMNRTLIQDFGIRKPRIAVLGLNPHAGDGGLTGDEEQRIIAPAVARAAEGSILALGPYSADGFFGSGNYASFDGILAMYHDQGLIPFKTLSFDTGVNFTAGLPAVRTSPDHGTGYDIAGKNVASEQSFRQALYLACDIFARRNNFRELTANPLRTNKIEQEKA